MAIQESLFPNTHKIVNVASVPLRSPFRYPGGKTWLVPQIRNWIASLPKKPEIFIEPFAGGGIISLTVGFENLADEVIFVEIDHEVASVWKTIINGNGKELAERIINFNFSSESVDTIINSRPINTFEQAFQTIIKNRVFHGGILAPGSGKIKHGENGKGIRSRWYPETLGKRIYKIDSIKEKFSFIEGDGFEIIQEYKDQENAIFFIDPPYTSGGKKAGRRLYTHHEIDHKRLFEISSRIKGDLLLTYSNDNVTRNLAKDYGFAIKEISMRNTRNKKMTELLIGRNLDWSSLTEPTSQT